MNKMPIKGRVKDALLNSNKWLSVVDVFDLVGGASATCYATVARALRKLWQEDIAAKTRLPGGSRVRMQWIAVVNAHKGFPDASVPAVSPNQKPKKVKKTKTGKSATNLNTGDLIMQIEQGIETIIGEWVAADKKFTAHDVTKELRERVNAGTLQVDPGLAGTAHVGGKDVTKIDHALVRDEVHKLMSSKFPSYNRATTGNFWEYSPSIASSTPAATVADPSTPPAQDGGSYDGNSSL